MKLQTPKFGVDIENANWELVRKRDNLKKYSKSIGWIEFNDDRTFKKEHDTINVGYNLLMSPKNKSFTWMTTEVTEIIENTAKCIHFKTKNSDYKLFKL
jgi:hypothetical protein